MHEGVPGFRAFSLHKALVGQTPGMTPVAAWAWAFGVRPVRPALCAARGTKQDEIIVPLFHQVYVFFLHFASQQIVGGASYHDVYFVDFEAMA